MTKTTAVLWLTLLATLAASWTHLTTLFARHEWPGWWPVAALAATAVDLGILASMMAIADLAAEGRDTSDPRWTVAGLVLLSCLANAAHVLAVGSTGGPLEMSLAVVVAAALPLIVWRLSRLLDAVSRPVGVQAGVVLRQAGADADSDEELRVVLEEMYYDYDPDEEAGQGPAEMLAMAPEPPAPVANTNGHSPAWLAKYLATVAEVGQDDQAVASAMGKSPRTVRNYRRLAKSAGSEAA